MSTPREKARKLVQKIHELDLDRDDYNGITWSMAKQCALIAVDEILDVLNVIDNFEMIYWEQVKQEIEKL
jgi:hypothetical protein